MSRVSVKKLLELYPESDPFKYPIWGDWVLNEEEVYRCVEKGMFEKTPQQRPKTNYEAWLGDFLDHAFHAKRVAWLVVDGWNDPIHIDVGVPSLGYEPDYVVDDGNHRLAAAILRGDETILAECSGDVKLIDELIVK